tara:strand:- start:10 stop:222 length:213 start_codon:yes stop_codon:yes gene_type:complete
MRELEKSHNTYARRAMAAPTPTRWTLPPALPALVIIPPPRSIHHGYHQMHAKIVRHVMLAIIGLPAATTP